MADNSKDVALTPGSPSCSFCRHLRKMKDDFEYYANQRPSMKENCTTKCSVALVDNHYYQGQYSGRATYEFNSLNFCPECGRRIEGEELEW